MPKTIIYISSDKISVLFINKFSGIFNYFLIRNKCYKFVLNNFFTNGAPYKQDEAALHLDHVTQHLGEWPSQVTVDEENRKPSGAISSVGLEKELTRDEDATVKQNASGQLDQCNDYVYAVVDKTMKKHQPTKVNKAV